MISRENTFPIIMFFLLLIASACNDEDASPKADTPVISSAQNDIVTDTGSRVSSIRVETDKINVESAIDMEKVDSLIAKVGLSFSEIRKTDKADDIMENIQKLDQLLGEEEIERDKELQFSVFGMLGKEYLRLFSATQAGKQEYLNKSIEYAQDAVRLFEEDPIYKPDLADLYSIIISGYIYKKKYRKAISLMEFLIKDYQNIDYGPYKNWYATRKVDLLYNLILMDEYTLAPEQEKKIIGFLKTIAENYENEVEISAKMKLVRHYASKQQTNKAKSGFNDLINRVAALNNPTFKEQKWTPFKIKMENIGEEHSPKTSNEERDTVYYEIESDMLQNVEIRDIDTNNGEVYQVGIQLKDRYHEEYGRLTQNNTGHFIAITYKGESLAPRLPVLRAGIMNGHVTLGPFKEQERAQKTAEMIKGKR